VRGGVSCLIRFYICRRQTLKDAQVAASRSHQPPVAAETATMSSASAAPIPPQQLFQPATCTVVLFLLVSRPTSFHFKLGPFNRACRRHLDTAVAVARVRQPRARIYGATEAPGRTAVERYSGGPKEGIPRAGTHARTHARDRAAAAAQDPSSTEMPCHTELRPIVAERPMSSIRN
jgi:hypothetical protein